MIAFQEAVKQEAARLSCVFSQRGVDVLIQHAADDIVKLRRQVESKHHDQLRAVGRVQRERNILLNTMQEARKILQDLKHDAPDACVQAIIKLKEATVRVENGKV